MREFACWLVRGARLLLTPLKPYPTCRYLPSCSQYTQDAIRERGLFAGGLSALWRLLRCNPFSRGGIDPVRRLRS